MCILCIVISIIILIIENKQFYKLQMLNNHHKTNAIIIDSKEYKLLSLPVLLCTCIKQSDTVYNFNSDKVA